MRLPAVLLTAFAVAACTPAAGENLSTPATSTPATSVQAMAQASARPAAGETSAPTAAAKPTPTPTFTVTDSSSATPTPTLTPTPTPTSTATRTPSPQPTVTTATVAPVPAGSYVLGDSISLAAAPALSRLGYRVTGRVGQAISTTYLATYLASADAQAAPAWVLILGTNNRGDAADVSRLPDWLQTIRSLRTPGAKQHVYWVTPHRPDAYSGGLSGFSLDAFNAALAEAAASYRWLDVLDYDTVARAHPEWFAGDGGHLHPDEAGQQALAELLAGPDARPAATPGAITELDRTGAGPPTSTLTPEQEYFQGYEFSND